LKIVPTELPGVVIVEPDAYADRRGRFFESWHQDRYRQVGLPAHFVQDNVANSVQGVLRGLHYQHPDAQGKLVFALAGEVFDVAADIRSGSPTWGKWVGVELSGENTRQLYVPPGFAHGYCVTSATAVVAYKCTAYYDATCDRGIRWNDPTLAVSWPVDVPILSDKDARAPLLADLSADALPSHYGP
jgi:dTDP-4-dehydrorhamnose 3,5-epimerase